MKGRYKVKMRRFNRWIVFEQLPSGEFYDEWLYLDGRGIPVLYWNKKLGSLILM